MPVKIVTVSKSLPQYARKTDEIIPYLEAWLSGQEDRFVRKVKKIFETSKLLQNKSDVKSVEDFKKKHFGN
jgi:CRISPR/Cas system-associated protein Cas7 (RAMP superfamily)